MGYVYVDKDDVPHVYTARKGELIKMTCDNWECPIPRVPNCYVERDACDPETEWCMVETHEKWGQWAMGQYGNSPDFDVEGHCGTYYDDIINRSARNLSLDPATIDKLRESRNAMCNSTTLGVTAGISWHKNPDASEDKWIRAATAETICTSTPQRNSIDPLCQIVASLQLGCDLRRRHGCELGQVLRVLPFEEFDSILCVCLPAEVAVGRGPVDLGRVLTGESSATVRSP